MYVYCLVNANEMVNVPLTRVRRLSNRETFRDSRGTFPLKFTSAKGRRSSRGPSPRLDVSVTVTGSWGLHGPSETPLRDPSRPPPPSGPLVTPLEGFLRSVVGVGIRSYCVRIPWLIVGETVGVVR